MISLFSNDTVDPNVHLRIKSLFQTLNLNFFSNWKRNMGEPTDFKDDCEAR